MCEPVVTAWLEKRDHTWHVICCDHLDCLRLEYIVNGQRESYCVMLPAQCEGIAATVMKPELVPLCAWTGLELQSHASRQLDNSRLDQLLKYKI